MLLRTRVLTLAFLASHLFLALSYFIRLHILELKSCMSVCVKTTLNPDACDKNFNFCWHLKWNVKGDEFDEVVEMCLHWAEALFAHSCQVALNMSIYQLKASNVNVEDETRRGFVVVALQYMEMQDCELFMFPSELSSLKNWYSIESFFFSLVYITLIQTCPVFNFSCTKLKNLKRLYSISVKINWSSWWSASEL